MSERKLRILIIEDEPLILKALNNLLLQKYEVFAAPDGETGLHLLREELPHLVLLDLILPGMHGFEVLKAAKADPITRPIPVVILSSVDEPENIEQGMLLGAHKYLVKQEVDFEIIRNTIREVLEKENGASTEK